jgi:hypothetical protein
MRPAELRRSLDGGGVMEQLLGGGEAMALPIGPDLGPLGPIWIMAGCLARAWACFPPVGLRMARDGGGGNMSRI